ncbi:MAG: YCF48-related protein [Candidatus Thorarchaeota archaeon]
MIKSNSYPFKFSKNFLIAIIISILVGPSLTSALFVSDSYSSDLQLDDYIWEILTHDYHQVDANPKDIAFLNASHGWVLSQNSSGYVHGIILHTQDSGDSWELQLYQNLRGFKHISIIDDQNLWVTSHGGLFHTSDGGIVWEYIALGEEYDVFDGIHFISDTHGWTGSNQEMFRTIDGGQTWQQIQSLPNDDQARDIHFVTVSDGWVMGFDGVYHTDDGGTTWDTQLDSGGWALSFVSNTEAWGVADDLLIHTTDGTQWIQQPIPPSSTPGAPYLTDVFFLDNENGWICGKLPKITYTPDGGINWYEQDTELDTRVTGIDFINESHGWAVAWGGYILRTTRGNTFDGNSMNDPRDILVWLLIGVVIIAIPATLILRRRSIRRGN